jgi:hypothetical protein
VGWQKKLTDNAPESPTFPCQGAAQCAFPGFSNWRFSVHFGAPDGRAVSMETIQLVSVNVSVSYGFNGEMREARRQ